MLLFRDQDIQQQDKIKFLKYLYNQEIFFFAGNYLSPAQYVPKSNCALMKYIHCDIHILQKFFRRALKEAEIYECKQQKMCVLNPRSRNACRYCRYQKCLDVGMSRQGKSIITIMYYLKK